MSEQPPQLPQGHEEFHNAVEFTPPHETAHPVVRLVEAKRGLANPPINPETAELTNTMFERIGENAAKKLGELSTGKHIKER